MIAMMNNQESWVAKWQRIAGKIENDLFLLIIINHINDFMIT
jgi:hypothetical protein